MNILKRLLVSAALLAAPGVRAAEFEVLDKLSVDGYSVFRGSADIPGGLFTVGESTFVVKDGRVGIGTTAPGAKLEVNGSGIVNGYLSVNTAAMGAYIPFTVKALGTGNSTLRLLGTNDTANVAMGSYDSDNGYLAVSDSNGLAKIFFAANGAYNSYINNGGNIGIGTTNPLAKLDVSGGLKISGDPALSGLNSANMVIDGSPNAYSRLELRQNAGASHYGFIQTRDASTNNVQMEFATGNTVRMVIGGAALSGNVGLGTTAPGYLLHLSRSNAGGIGPEIFLNNSAGTYGDESALTFASGGSSRGRIRNTLNGDAYGSGNIVFETLNPLNSFGERVRITSAGNVGIGTTGPQTTLHVSGGSVAESIPLIISGMTGPLTEPNDVVGLGFAYNTAPGYVKAGILARAANAEADMDLHFAATNIGGTHMIGFSDTKMSIIGASGNVGIGTTNPGAKLDVSGSIQAGDIITTNSWYDLLVPSGWSSASGKCRVVNGWIELRGYMAFPTIVAGWPSSTVTLLPSQCRPQTVRYTETPCHAAQTPRPCVANNDFYPDGTVMIYTDQSISQLRLEGLRIWGGAQ